MYNKNTICGVRSSVQNGIHSIYSGAGILGDRQGLRLRGKSEALRCSTHLVYTGFIILPRCGTGGFTLHIRNGRFPVRFFSFIRFANPRSTFPRTRQVPRLQPCKYPVLSYTQTPTRNLRSPFRIRFSPPRLPGV